MTHTDPRPLDYTWPAILREGRRDLDWPTCGECTRFADGRCTRNGRQRWPLSDACESGYDARQSA